jgi:prefoldin subunit 5
MALQPKLSLSQRVSASYSELSSLATDLNAVSDALGKAVSDIDEGLKKLNLGVTAWVEVQKYRGSREQDLTYTVEELGYAKINGKWGIALRVRSGDDERPEWDESVEVSLFNEAARALRLKAIKKIPELLNKLNEEATKVTKELQAKLADAQAVACAVQEAASAPKSPSVGARPLLRPATPPITPSPSVGARPLLRPATPPITPSPSVGARPVLRPATPPNTSLLDTFTALRNNSEVEK